MKEIILTGKHYRVMGSILKRIWYRISFWTAAKDVEFKDGTNLEDKYSEVEVNISSDDWIEHMDKDNNVDYYISELAVNRITNAHPYISLLPYESDAIFPTNNELEQYSKISVVKTTEHSLIFYAHTKPDCTIRLNIQGVIGL